MLGFSDVHHHHPPGAPAAAPGGAERIAEAGGDPLGGTDPGWLAAARASGGDPVQAVRQQRARARVVLVGSGTSVLADEYGAGIDTFDTVVRFNKWHIDGYSQFVGTKISEWYVNNLDTRLDKQPKKAWAPGFLDLLGDRRHRIPGIKVIVPSSKSKKKVTQALRRYKRIWPLVRFNTFNHNGGLAERIRRKYHFSERFFSMGMIAIAQNLQHPPVVLHGFDFGKGSHGHYWENLRSKETCHNVRGEGFAIQQMEKQGDVVRLKCLMAQTAQEVDAECRVSTLVAPQQNWIGGCTTDNKGPRKDMAGRHNEHEFGTAGLPRPILAPH